MADLLCSRTGRQRRYDKLTSHIENHALGMLITYGLIYDCGNGRNEGTRVAPQLKSACVGIVHMRLLC